jgi:CRP-like cAMP-binding protein
LHRRGNAFDHVYFPNGGVCSFTTLMADGSMIEVATIGNEGMVGLAALYGTGRGLGETFVQTGPSTALELPVDILVREVERRGALDQILRRYMVAFMRSVMQGVACNALHTLHQRCCRWLLMTLDRADSNEFSLSQEFLAVMVGARRPTVSTIAAHLQEMGLIRYRHGRIQVLDRHGLERAACECYGTIRREFQDIGLSDKASQS